MSTKFDWSQFETVSPQNSDQGFDWNQFEMHEEPEEKTRSIDLPKAGFGKHFAEKSQIPEMERTLGRTGKVVGSTVAGLPGDVAGLIGQGLNVLAENVPGGKPKSEEELKEITENPFTSTSIQRGLEKISPSLAPKNSEEKEWEENLGLITSLLIPVPGGQSKKVTDPRLQSKIYKAGKALGFSGKELTPLLQGEMKTELLSKLTKKSKGIEKALSLTKNKMDAVYENILERSSVLPEISEKNSEKLITEFSKARHSLAKTIKAAPDKEAAIKYIDESLEKIRNFGADPQELINGYFDINRTVNWNSIRGGKKALAQLKEPIKQVLRLENPKLAADFENANRLYAQMKTFEKSVGLPKIAEFGSYSKANEFLMALLSGNLVGLKGAGTAYGTYKGAQKVAIELLTNPKWQNLHRKLMHAVKRGLVRSGPVLINELKNLTKRDLPEVEEKFDWSKFQ